ncbi:putative delta-60 repeat protein/putative repeat protein (TIGR01451 family) [Streptomyces sp. SAI-170]|uniref:calcium-binding protein n=1 Tax=Streptomyces sp. SAI-170 TaxID=3377729 RepID=UPI003C7AFB0C
MLTPHTRRARRHPGSLPARAGTVAATVLALVLTLPGTAAAAPGDLDTTFSGDGRVATDFNGGSYDESRDMAVQADGRIVTVGLTQHPGTGEIDFALARYRTDGSLDPEFGGDGRVIADVRGGEDVANGVAVQPDGKIVVVGRSADPETFETRFTVTRFNPDGSFDTGFGSGGVVLTSLPATQGSGEAHAVQLYGDGRILVAGLSGFEYGPSDFAVARYHSDGSLDTDFAGDGTVTTAFANGASAAYDVALQSDGKIVAAGRGRYNYPANASDFAVVRYTADGSLDTGFDGDGKVVTGFGEADSAGGVKVQPDGKIVLAGSSDFDFALARYASDGALDPGFGGDGKVVTDFAGGSLDGSSDLALQSDGKIVAAGISQADFAVARYNPDGSLDPAFSGDGKVTTDVDNGFFDVANAVAIQSDGKIVASGNTGDDGGLVRYQVAAAPPGADLSVTKTGTTTMSIGSRATYTVTVTNNTAGTSATGVTLTDTLTGPAGSVISATTNRGSCTTNADGAVCNLGTLAPGAAGAATVTIVVEPRATGTLTDRATVTSTTSDPTPGNNTATKTTTIDNARGCTRIGTSGNDTITGTSGTDVICALSGDDTVNASYGNDTVFGDYGNDRLDGGFQDDRLVGGPGNDTLTGNYGNDRLEAVDGVSGNDTANGGPGSDTCTTDSGDARISCP